ncbi:MAG: chemotaxis protein CheB [Candidatus Hodarchaeota archaeon]
MTNFQKKLIIIGASVGGPAAIFLLLSEFPTQFSPVIIVQHMYKEMVTPWTKNLQKYFPHLKIDVPKNKEAIKSDHIYIAEGGKHCEVTEERKIYSYQGDRVNFVIPSVDVTFISAAKVYGENLLGIILTGTGRDGAYGAKKIKESGGTIIVEHDSTCVIDSMPKAVIEAKLADQILPIHDIPFMLRKDGWI